MDLVLSHVSLELRVSTETSTGNPSIPECLLVSTLLS
jgi:hypothetical protein